MCPWPFSDGKVLYNTVTYKDLSAEAGLPALHIQKMLHLSDSIHTIHVLIYLKKIKLKNIYFFHSYSWVSSVPSVNILKVVKLHNIDLKVLHTTFVTHPFTQTFTHWLC